MNKLLDKMNYWNIQLHPNNLGWNRERELLEKHGVIGLGDWDEAAQQQPNFENAMQKGDVVLVKHGATIIALVEVIGDYEYNTQTDDLLWFERRRRVKVLDWYDETYGYIVSSRKTLEKSINSSTNTYTSIKKWIQRINNKKNMETITNLLKSNHNLILTGAPGTGKTYLAQQIARELGCTADHIGFVQFHPSYDYTDFVEGIRPIQDGGKDIGFKPKDGVFKQFCEKALTAYLNADNEADAPKFVFIIDEINRGDISKIFGELFFSIDPGYRVTKDMLDNHKSGKALLMTVKTQYANMQEKCPNAFDEALGINDVNDCGHFFVPENVYIIGTMNDIDRSVESMDFAFRRRFAFKEIKADENIGMLDGMDNREKIINRMNNLNCEIEKTEGLSPAYHIGGSYFMKLKDYQKKDDSYDYDALWNNHIVGLLSEYLRNQPEAKDKIKKFKEEFDKEEPHTENNQE